MKPRCMTQTDIFQHVSFITVCTSIQKPDNGFTEVLCQHCKHHWKLNFLYPFIQPSVSHPDEGPIQRFTLWHRQRQHKGLTTRTCHSTNYFTEQREVEVRVARRVTNMTFTQEATVHIPLKPSFTCDFVILTEVYV